MNTNLADLQSFIYNKRICLIGNSKSILSHPHDIDSYDIVGRINKGFPIGKEKFLGSRTDVLFLATKMEESDIKKFNPSYLIWTTEDTTRQTEFVARNSILNPTWRKLSKSLNALPSTGCAALVFLLSYIDFAQLDIYGFDFFKSGTWYHSMHQKWHDGTREEIYTTNLLKTNPKIRLII